MFCTIRSEIDDMSRSATGHPLETTFQRRFTGFPCPRASRQEVSLLWMGLICLLLAMGCDSQCMKEQDSLWPPSDDEYRLWLTNQSPFPVEVEVDGESLGVYCAGLRRVSLGNFPRNGCSRIRAYFLDNPSEIWLDDCEEPSISACKSNNSEGRVCFDTREVDEVQATLH